jgi:flagellar hook-associated protein 1 FlgK
MPGSFFGLTIGASGLAAAQLGQDVTGHNIANSATPGYSEQTASFQAGDPYTPPNEYTGSSVGMLGTGVVVGSITRSRNQFLDQQVRGATSQQSNESAQSTALTQMEDAFGEPSSTGLNASLGTLFQSFNNLVNNPEDTGVRATVVQSADALSREFQNVNSTLTGIGQQLTANQTDDMNSLNSYGQQIANLNATIRSATTQTQNANDLMDQRDLLLDKLSSLANISVTNNSDGTVNVSIGTSQLVQGTDASTLSLTGSNSLTARGDLTGGDLAGLAQSQTDLAGYQTDLNNLASTVISQVNSVHENGAGLDGSTGLQFFTGTDASNIAVNQVLVNDPDKVAAAAVPAGGGVPAPGDASNATLLGALENTQMTTGPLAGETMQGFYQASVSNLAGQEASAASALTTASSNVTQLTQQRDSVSGVSTDAEMVNMMKYQQAYTASAKVVQTMNDMLGTLITDLTSGN